MENGEKTAVKNTAGGIKMMSHGCNPARMERAREDDQHTHTPSDDARVVWGCVPLLLLQLPGHQGLVLSRHDRDLQRVGVSLLPESSLEKHAEGL